MTSQQRQNVVNQQIANDQAHAAKTEEERKLQQERISRFDSSLAGLDAALEDNLRRAKNATTDHQDTMNKLKSAENDLVREKTAIHQEIMKEMGKNANRDLEALQNSEAASQATMMAHQSAEKKRIEENRRQADKEAAEKIENARTETAKTRDLAHEHTKERTEYTRKVEKEQKEEIKEMKRELLDNEKIEAGRQEHHAKTVESIGFVKIGARMNMDAAGEQMRKNREANNEIFKVTDEIVGLQRTINDISSKVRVAHKLRKPKVLMQQYSILLRSSEAVKTKKSSIENKMIELQRLNIDGHDAERKVIMDSVHEDLQKLNELNNGITMLGGSDPDMDFLDSLLEIIEDGVKVMESVKTNWENLPKVDTTNLIHSEFLKTTGVLMSDAKLAAVEAVEVKAVEDVEVVKVVEVNAME